MDTLLTPLANPGRQWVVHYDESDILSHIDGYLIMYVDTCRIILRSELPEGVRERGIKTLTRIVRTRPIGDIDIVLWHRDDE